MFDQPIKYVMEQKKFLTAPPETTVSRAAQQMAEKNVGAVLVVENGNLVGIFSERDAVFRVMAKGLDAVTTRLIDVMTASPKTLDAAKTYGHALLLMQENGFRHVPVMDNGRLVGIVSSRNAMDPDIEDFISEERRREHHR
ncbi:MAG: CBS domain-containing protein [Betaproteobacteria bacterium]|nr:CBS domain-containing protein [Betaproteobacteria bacterium]